MVNHNQKQVKSGREGKIGDEVDGQLLERAGAGGQEGQKGRDCQVSVDLHLLTNSTAHDETAYESRHTRPPIVAGQGGISTEEPGMAGGK